MSNSKEIKKGEPDFNITLQYITNVFHCKSLYVSFKKFLHCIRKLNWQKKIVAFNKTFLQQRLKKTQNNINKSNILNIVETFIKIYF